MKIGIYDPYLDDLGGGEKYMMTIAECLAKEHEVFVFWDRKKDIEELRRRFTLDIDTVKLTKNIFSPQVPFLQRLAASQQYDAIFVLSDGSIPLLLCKKLFLHIQQPLDAELVRSWKEKLKLARVTKVFYNSRFTKSWNAKLLPDSKVTIVYPPVSLHVKDTKKENMILHVGRFRVKNVGMADFKKQSVMVDAFKRMVERGLKGWEFVIATGVKEDDEVAFQTLRDAAKGYPIRFVINKSNDALWEIYNKAKIYWHASGYGEDLEQHPEYAEHFGISTVEAMGAGAVPVVINAGGQKEIVTDGRDGFLWDTLEELEEKTRRLTNDTALWHTLSSQAQKRAEVFTQEKFSHAIKALLV